MSGAPARADAGLLDSVGSLWTPPHWALGRCCPPGRLALTVMSTQHNPGQRGAHPQSSTPTPGNPTPKASFQMKAPGRGHQHEPLLCHQAPACRPPASCTRQESRPMLAHCPALPVPEPETKTHLKLRAHCPHWPVSHPSKPGDTHRAAQPSSPPPQRHNPAA